MRLKIKGAIGIFLAVAGFVGVMAQLITSPSPVRSTGLFLLFVTVLLLGIAFLVQIILRILKARHALPSVKKLEDISTGYFLVPATREDIDWIAHLEAEAYPQDAVPKHVLMEWYNINPSGFSVIKMKNGKKAGHIDILPLRPATLQTFLAGNIAERDIRGDSLFAPTDRHLIRDLYVESIIVSPPKGKSNALALLRVLASFNVLVERMCVPANVEKVYAIAASKPGENLLEGLGFSRIKEAQDRIDHHNLYAAEFEDLENNIAEICGTRLQRLDSPILDNQALSTL